MHITWGMDCEGRTSRNPQWTMSHSVSDISRTFKTEAITLSQIPGVILGTPIGKNKTVA